LRIKKTKKEVLQAERDPIVYFYILIYIYTYFIGIEESDHEEEDNSENEKEIEKLRSLGYDGLHAASAETFTLPHKFDTIVAGELIEHLSNPGLFLERAKKHLTEGGRLVLTTPYPFSLLYTLYALFKFPKTCQNPEHTCWFCPRTIGELARRSGFRIVKWNLIEDYRFDDPSPRYRFFVKLILLFGFLIPKRLRCNTMLFILERDADHPCS